MFKEAVSFSTLASVDVPKDVSSVLVAAAILLKQAKLEAPVCQGFGTR